MSHDNEQSPNDQDSENGANGLPEELESELYSIYFDSPAEERKTKFDALVRDNADHAGALEAAQQALSRSENMLGHLRTELDDASSTSRHVGPFEVLRVLGEGGFGTVYLARQHKPVNRHIALKVLHKSHTDARSKRRFEAERQLLARLQHENIAQIYDAGVTDDQQHYLAMEFVDGKPITTWSRENDANVETRLQMFLRVCQAIHHAHQREVVHRDLKPSNVLVHDQDGQPVPKVIDFGIAKLIATQSADSDAIAEPTLIGAQVGTPGYMSPEQAAGEWIDTRTDVYSLGVLLCELLTGEQPLHRSKLRSSSFVAMARTMAEEPPRRPSSIAGRTDRKLFERLREDLDWIVLKAVAPKRDDRYTSVAALADDVKRHLDSEPVLARQNATGYVLRKFAQRHRLGVTLASLAAVALVAALLLMSWGLGVLDTARTEAEQGRDLAEKRGAAARMATAQLALESGDAETLRAYLPSVPPERRHWGWRHLAARVEQSDSIIDAKEIYHDAVWLDDKRVVGFPHLGEITCWNVESGAAEFTFAGWRDRFNEVAFAPEFELALIAGSKNISLWDVRAGMFKRNVHRVKRQTLAIAWSDDRTLAIISGKGGWLDLVPIRMDDIPGSSVPPGTTPAAGQLTKAKRLKFGDTITALAFCGNDELVLGFKGGEVRRVELMTGKTLGLMKGHTDAVDHIVVDRENNRIYSGSIDTSVRAWNLETSDPQAKRTLGVRVMRLVLSEDRKMLYAGGGWTDNRLVAWHTDTFELAGRFNGHRAGIRSLAMSPDQRHLASCSRDGTVRIWPNEPPRDRQVLDAGYDARELSTNNDRSLFATASLGGAINVWNAHTLEPVLQLKTKDSWYGSAFHGDLLYVVGYKVIRAIRISDGKTVHEGVNTQQLQRLVAIPETDRIMSCYQKNLLVWRLSDLTLLHEHPLNPDAGRIFWDAHAGKLMLGDTTGVLHTLDATDGTITSSRSPFETSGPTGATACRGDLFVHGIENQLRFERSGKSQQTVTVRNGCASISADTRRVVTGGADNKVRLWDPDTGDQRLVLGGMPYNIAGVHFVDGGRRIIALTHRWNAQCKVHVWTAPATSDSDSRASGR